MTVGNVISLLALLLSLMFNVIVVARNTKEDSKSTNDQKTTLLIKLETINNNVIELKADIQGVKQDITTLREDNVRFHEFRERTEKRLEILETGGVSHA